MIALAATRNKLLVAALLLVLSGAALTATILADPGVADLAVRNPGSTAFIERYRAAARAAGEPDRLRWRWVPGSRMAPAVKVAVLVSEDIGFYSHRGFAPAEMRLALKEALAERETPRGASTITQQLAKNLWLSPSRSPWRKLREAALTWRLERALSKDRILEIYLNVVEFGPGIYGVEAAAQAYFGKAAAELTDHEAAQLAASLPQPSRWNPASELRGYHRHVAVVEARMRRSPFLWRRLGVALPDSLPPAMDTVPRPAGDTVHGPPPPDDSATAPAGRS